MSLESILSHILNDADMQRQKIIRQITLEAEGILEKAHNEAALLYEEIIRRRKAQYEAEKQRRIVNARLEYKKNLLLAKQELIEEVFKKLKTTLGLEKFKKQQVFADKVKEATEDIDFYLNKVRLDYETAIAKILFG